MVVLYCGCGGTRTPVVRRRLVYSEVQLPLCDAPISRGIIYKKTGPGKVPSKLLASLARSARKALFSKCADFHHTPRASRAQAVSDWRQQESNLYSRRHHAGRPASGHATGPARCTPRRYQTTSPPCIRIYNRYSARSKRVMSPMPARIATSWIAEWPACFVLCSSGTRSDPAM